jgi:ribosomal-protein-alanine N-acetyltransferase
MFSKQTARLVIRPFNEDDAGFVNKLYNSEGFLRFIGDRNIRSDEDACEFLRNGPLTMYRDHGVGLCMVEDKESGVPLGCCGLIKRDTLDDIDIGYAFMPEFEGRGYCTEATQAVMAFARNELGLTRVVAITQADNPGSIRVLEKLGLRFEENLEEPEGAAALALYGIDF